jgi:DNA-binding CsgD family transcriptional regulator
MCSRLTETEAHLMRLAAAGLSADEIAESLGLGRRVVAWHLAQSYRKLGVGTRAPDRSHTRLDDAQG